MDFGFVTLSFIVLGGIVEILSILRHSVEPNKEVKETMKRIKRGEAV